MRPEAELVQLTLWEQFPPTRRPKRLRRSRKPVDPNAEPEGPGDYPNRRPRRCSYCRSWFRPPNQVLPEHKEPNGSICQGSKRKAGILINEPLFGEGWQDQAACRETWKDPETKDIFWLPDFEPTVLKALTYCHGCPVLADCWKQAYGDSFFYGVAGGRTWSPRERRAIDKDKL
jgi:hypothetical protein